MANTEVLTSVYIHLHDPAAPDREWAFHVDTIKTVEDGGDTFTKQCQYPMGVAIERGFTLPAMFAGLNVDVIKERDALKARIAEAEAKQEKAEAEAATFKEQAVEAITQRDMMRAFIAKLAGGEAAPKPEEQAGEQPGAEAPAQ